VRGGGGGVGGMSRSGGSQGISIEHATSCEWIGGHSHEAKRDV